MRMPSIGGTALKSGVGTPPFGRELFADKGLRANPKLPPGTSGKVSVSDTGNGFVRHPAPLFVGFAFRKLTFGLDGSSLDSYHLLYLIYHFAL